MEPKSPSKSKSQNLGFSQIPRTVKIGIFILIFLFVVLVGGFFISWSSLVHCFSKRDFYYTVVLDCGSTGTRVNVYKWIVNGSSRDGNLPVLLRSYPENSDKIHGCEYHCMQTEPGLDKFVGNASGVTVSLEPLIHLAKQWVPLKMHGVTPIFVLATAGMRRLSYEDSWQVLEDVEDVVKKHSFLYRKRWIRVLSGKEEAYYGWIALNYKMGIFGKASRSPTLGLLDLGGSSLQVVTEVDELRQDEHIVLSKVGKFQHYILSYSLPAFGLNEAFDRTVSMLSHSHALTENTGGKFEIKHPCLSSGILQNYTCRSCFGYNPASSENISAKMEENDLNSVLLSGGSNWEECKILARAVAVNSSDTDLSWTRDHSNCLGFFLTWSYRNAESDSRISPSQTLSCIIWFLCCPEKVKFKFKSKFDKDVGDIRALVF